MDDFLSETFSDFRRFFLNEDALDKSPSPKLTGEISKLASKANEAITDRLNNYLKNFYNKVSHRIDAAKKKNKDLDIDVEMNPIENWVDRGAAILNIFLNNTSNFSNMKIVLSIFDNNNVRIALPKEIINLFKRKIGGRYKGSMAIKKSWADLEAILKAVM